MSFSAWFIPLLITGLFSWGLCSGVDVFDCFLQGAKEGLKTAASITPALVCLRWSPCSATAAPWMSSPASFAP